MDFKCSQSRRSCGARRGYGKMGFHCMTICVFGLWHLGCVTAACAAQRYRVIALDPDEGRIASLQRGVAPLSEPGLEELIKTGVSLGALSFTSDVAAALEKADIVWVTFDTPVDESDDANFGYVESQISTLFSYLREDAIVLISSQLPVGSTARVEAAYRKQCPRGSAHFAYSPENLRLGRAIAVFRNPGRIVVGIRNPADRERLGAFLSPFCENLIWMSVESAEMTKHALNAFLAGSVAFINEVAALCECVGADAKQVEQGLKSDERIGPRAYLGAGGAFSGGTLARDVRFLSAAAKRLEVPAQLLDAIEKSNELHKQWPQRKLVSVLGGLEGKTVAVLGLTYKPGTDTLRRSASVELCRWLSSQRASVRAFDPAVKQVPEALPITLCDSALQAVEGADAVVIATEWPVFRELTAPELVTKMRKPLVLDANRFLEASLGSAPGLEYLTVGKPRESR